MERIKDFEDMLFLLNKHEVRYLIIGGLAFIFHAKPRYTKDMDLWIGPDRDNITRANRALAEFGSPTLLGYDEPSQMVQIGVAPNRIDLLVAAGDLDFETAFAQKVVSSYGDSDADWIGLDSLIEIKGNIDKPRHQDDARILRQVKKMREQK